MLIRIAKCKKAPMVSQGETEKPDDPTQQPTIVTNTEKPTRIATVAGRYHSSAIGAVAVAAAFLAVSYITPRVWVLVSRNTELIDGRLAEINGRSPAQ